MTHLQLHHHFWGLMHRTCIVMVALAASGSAFARDFGIRYGEHIEMDIDTTMAPVVARAYEIVSRDFGYVLGAEVGIGTDSPVIVACISDIGHTQGFRIGVSNDGLLRVTGNDPHGLAYGLLELSRLIGVSPWEWWADAIPETRKAFGLKAGYSDEQWPKVEYRGIFINDEDWGMKVWSNRRNSVSEGTSSTTVNGSTTYSGKRGVIGPDVNARIFELLLRLRANYFWPAMHECTQPFFMTSGNREAAARYGIFIGGSHCEPMACSPAVEWGLRGKGEYNYATNRDNVKAFWQERLDEVKGQDILYTIGMRGVHDSGMQGAKTLEEKKTLLQQVIDDQRRMLDGQRPATGDRRPVPQVFVPYKEVQEIYEAGLDVPDDVCLMWCDDNYGYIRHYPTPEEAARSGGNGVYYHVSYWGAPMDYLWLGTFSPRLLEMQMTEAYQRGIQRIWVLNVGDLKPAEYQTELFLDMAWKGPEGLASKSGGESGELESFLVREFGRKTGRALAPVMERHYELAFIRKPEFLGGTRVYENPRAQWLEIRDLPWSDDYLKARLQAYGELEDEVERLWGQVAENRKDTYFQLVKYPVQAAAEMNKKFIYAQLARHGHGEHYWNMSDMAYDSIAVLTANYNKGFGNQGKWQGMMDMSPRSLSVFGKVGRTPSSLDADGIGTKSQDPQFLWQPMPKGEVTEYSLGKMASGDIEIRILPRFPVVENGMLRVEARIDDEPWQTLHFETTYHAEQWKQNVLQNYAPAVLHSQPSVTAAKRRHTLRLRALDEGMVLMGIAKLK